MVNKNLQLLLILLSSFLIIVGYGHGIGPIVLLTIVGLISLFNGEYRGSNINHALENLNFVGDYEDVIPSVAFLMLIGFLIALVAIFIKKRLAKKICILIGLSFMILGYLFLVLPLNSGLRMFTGATGIPFFLLATKLIIELILEKQFPEKNVQ